MRSSGRYIFKNVHRNNISEVESVLDIMYTVIDLL